MKKKHKKQVKKPEKDHWKIVSKLETIFGTFIISLGIFFLVGVPYASYQRDGFMTEHGILLIGGAIFYIIFCWIMYRRFYEIRIID